MICRSTYLCIAITFGLKSSPGPRDSRDWPLLPTPPSRHSARPLRLLFPLWEYRAHCLPHPGLRPPGPLGSRSLMQMSSFNLKHNPKKKNKVLIHFHIDTPATLCPRSWQATAHRPNRGYHLFLCDLQQRMVLRFLWTGKKKSKE